MDVSWMLQCRMNTELPPYSKMDRGEKAALRRAAQAEHAFRVSKGYERDTLWTRLKYRLFWNRGTF